MASGASEARPAPGNILTLPLALPPTPLVIGIVLLGGGDATAETTDAPPDRTEAAGVAVMISTVAPLSTSALSGLDIGGAGAAITTRCSTPTSAEPAEEALPKVAVDGVSKTPPPLLPAIP